VAKKTAKRKSTRKPLRRVLETKQFTRARLQSGRYTKFKSGRNLIFEVWETKLVPQRYKRGPKKGRVNTKKPKIKKQKFVRYLNQLDKKKNPIPRSYTAVQYRFLTIKKNRQPRVVDPFASSVTIEFNNRALILDQLLMKKGDALKNYIRKFKVDLLELRAAILTDRGDQFYSPGIVIAPSTPWPQQAQIIAMNIIIGPMTDQSIRMSPKKFQKNKRNQMKQIWVTFTAFKIQN